MDSLENRFGELVRIARKECGVSQEELAGLAGIDRSYMSRIERGIVSISLEKVYLIANALNCEISDLLPPRSTVRVAVKR